MTRKILATLLFGILIQIGYGQTFDKAKLDTYFNTLETNNKFMGSIAVLSDGEIIYSKTIGFSDIENNLRANENSKYKIGSISKTFTSVLVLKAVEENKLDLNQTLNTWFPTVKNAEKITLKHLLSHRSGIHNITSDPDYLSWNTQPKTEQEMLAVITEAGSDFEPDSQAQYSNSNFILLTYILEKTFNKTYSELLQSFIIEPVGLQNTYFGGKIDTDKNECQSYRYGGSWKLESETDTSIPLGAGGIVSTAVDLTKMIDALLNGKLLNQESLELMKTMNDGYGIGLIQLPFFDKIGYGHTGGIDGFSSIFAYFPDSKISFAYTSNGLNYNLNKISVAILSAVFGQSFEIPEFSTYEVNPEDLNQYTGIYISNEIPLKITVTIKDNILTAQATGQPSFPLECTAKDIFKFDQAGVVLEFNPVDKTMILKQSGMIFNYTKE